MSILKNKIDFVALVAVNGANPNGDPNAENMPRVDDEMYGEISSGCIHRKIRNRMQDMGHNIFIQSEDRTTSASSSVKPVFSASCTLMAPFTMYNPNLTKCFAPIRSEDI